jgi:hypothetical protein
MAKRRSTLKGTVYGGSTSTSSGGGTSTSFGGGTSTSSGGTTLSGGGTGGLTVSYGGGSASYLPLDYTVTTVVSTPINEPEFSFYIPNSEFYINTPAISVANVAKSRTNFNDGVFYFMNKNNTPVYYKDFVLGSVSTKVASTATLQPSKSIFNPSAVIRASFIKSSDKVVDITIDTNNITNDEVYTYIPYNVIYKGNPLGILSIRILNKIYNNPNISIFPFESIGFAASFVGLNTGSLSKLYYGRTIKSLDKNVGTIDFTFNFEYYVTNPLNSQLTPNVLAQPMVISINFVNTGYVPSVISLSTTPPPTGGGYTPPSYTPVAAAGSAV